MLWAYNVVHASANIHYTDIESGSTTPVHHARSAKEIDVKLENTT